jgi:ribose 5-phosphate isomerase B
MRIALASDHAGYDYKELLHELLRGLGHEVHDFGTISRDPVDYPEFIRPAAQAVARGEFERGIVLGGSGNGEAMVANKVRGVRCALCWSLDTARWARQHNDANVLALGQRTIAFDLAREIVRVWLETAFAAGRHLQRVRSIEPE